MDSHKLPLVSIRSKSIPHLKHVLLCDIPAWFVRLEVDREDLVTFSECLLSLLERHILLGGSSLQTSSDRGGRECMADEVCFLVFYVVEEAEHTSDDQHQKEDSDTPGWGEADGFAVEV